MNRSKIEVKANGIRSKRTRGISGAVLAATVIGVLGSALPATAQGSESNIPLQLKLYTGGWWVSGDDNPWRLGFTVNSVPREWGDATFVDDGMAFGFGFGVESKVTMPLHYGLEVEWGFMSGGSVLYLGAGLGYNHDMGNNLYLQGKLGFGLAWLDKEVVELDSDGNTRWNIFGEGTLYEPVAVLTMDYFTLRPALNVFYRFGGESSRFLFTAGLGYQIPVYSSDLGFEFVGKDENGDRDRIEIGPDRLGSSFRLGDNVGGNTETTAAPSGIFFNVGIAFEL